MPLIDLNGLGYFKGKENAMVAGTYSASNTYAVGDYVYYSGTLYRCTTAITTAEAWTAAHWTAAKLAEDLTSQSEKIDGVKIDDLTDLYPLIYEKEFDGFNYRTDGKYIAPGGTSIGASAPIGYTELFPTKPGDFWFYCGKLTNAFPYVWGYSDKKLSNPTAISPNGPNDGGKVFVVPEGIYYIRAQAITNGSTSTPFFFCHENNAIYYMASLGSFRTFLSTYASNATASKPLKIYINGGTYNFNSEFTDEEKASSSFIGIQLPNYVSLEGRRSDNTLRPTLSCSVSSSSISTLNLGVGNKLKNLIVTGENCKYAIHDDYNAKFNTRVIENCDVVATNCSYGFAYGGGCTSGGHFYFKNCKFTATNYDGGGFEMHSNTGFTAPTFMQLDNCEFDSQNGHPEKAFELRALGNNTIVNTCVLNNCKTNGYKLTVGNNIVDWNIVGSGNSNTVYVESANSNFKLKFYDLPVTDSTLSSLGANAIGLMRFVSGIPQWWNGTAWVDATGTVVT